MKGSKSLGESFYMFFNDILKLTLFQCGWSDHVSEMAMGLKRSLMLLIELKNRTSSSIHITKLPLLNRAGCAW